MCIAIHIKERGEHKKSPLLSNVLLTQGAGFYLSISLLIASLVE